MDRLGGESNLFPNILDELFVFTSTTQMKSDDANSCARTIYDRFVATRGFHEAAAGAFRFRLLRCSSREKIPLWKCAADLLDRLDASSADKFMTALDLGKLAGTVAAPPGAPLPSGWSHLSQRIKRYTIQQRLVDDIVKTVAEVGQQRDDKTKKGGGASKGGGRRRCTSSQGPLYSVTNRKVVDWLSASSHGGDDNNSNNNNNYSSGASVVRKRDRESDYDGAPGGGFGLVMSLAKLPAACQQITTSLSAMSTAAGGALRGPGTVFDVTVEVPLSPTASESSSRD
eukprot:PhM_4_TR1953/c0_g1_i1/m.40095